VRATRIAIALVLIVGLSGCSGAAEKPHADAVQSNAVPSITPTPIPTPAESAPPVAPAPYPDADLLFTITATMRLKGGATAAMTESVYTPVSYYELDSALKKQLKEQECFYGDAVPTDFVYLRAFASTSDSSTDGRTWPTDPYSSPTISLGQFQVLDGDVIGFQAMCSTAILQQGSAIGTGVLLADAGPRDVGGWARQEYGFSAVIDGEPDDWDTVPTFADCAMNLGPASDGLSAAAAKKFSTRTSGPKSDGKFNSIICHFGTQEYFQLAQYDESDPDDESDDSDD
jgi:hypothetical protein